MNTAARSAINARLHRRRRSCVRITRRALFQSRVSMISRGFVISIPNLALWGLPVILVVMKCAMMMVTVRSFAPREIAPKVTVVHQGNVSAI